MRRACEQDDLTQLAKLAHWLKGSGGTAGFDDFTAPAAELEQLSFPLEYNSQVRVAALERQAERSRITALSIAALIGKP